MTVFVLVSTIDGYVYGVFDDEEKAYEHGNFGVSGLSWDVYEREVQ